MSSLGRTWTRSGSLSACNIKATVCYLPYTNFHEQAQEVLINENLFYLYLFFNRCFRCYHFSQFISYFSQFFIRIELINFKVFTSLK